MKIIILLLVANVCSTLAEEEDLTKFGNRVYELVTSADIFDKFFSLPSDPKEEERIFFAGTLEFMEYLGINGYDQVKRAADSSIDNFNGKMTPNKNFKVEVNQKERYLNHKGLLTPENTDFYADMYFHSLKNELDQAESSGKSVVPYILLKWGDIHFYNWLGITPEEGRIQMITYADQLEAIRYS